MNTATSVPERGLGIDELDRAIVERAAVMNAVTYELLVLVREFDERAGWLKWGFTSCTEWLHWRCDLSLSAAREKVRVAHALKPLPETSAAFARGVLSYSKVRALTRVATPLNEASLLEFALTTTAARVEERCRQLRNVQPDNADEANRIHGQRALRVWRDHHRGTMTITVELPIEEGELIGQALDKAIEAMPCEGPEFAATSWQAQQADALVAVARCYLNGDVGAPASAADNYQVVVHVDHSALTKGEGRADLPLASVKRLSCDGSVLSMRDGADGEPLSVGRKQRTVPIAIKRALWARDRGCSFPGCTHTRFVDAHHVRHWAQGGETRLENLMLLCSAHHRLVHEGGYAILRDHQHRWYFQRPDGRAIPAHGYQPEDMIDDDLDAPRDAHTSANVLGGRRGSHRYDGVSEAAAPYHAAGGSVIDNESHSRNTSAEGCALQSRCGFFTSPESVTVPVI